MANTIKVVFPQGQIVQTPEGKAKIVYNQRYVNKFNSDLNKTQVFLDNKVIMNLMKYVSKKTGMQELSIRLSSDAGSGKVHINVPYAQYQAYSKRITKRVGLRGTQPWERMCSDKKSEILKQVCEYSRRINNG